MLRALALSICVLAGLLLQAPAAQAQQLQSFKDCAVGKRVSTNDGRKGTITRLDRDWSYCYVRFDDNGQEASYLYSLLNAEGRAPRDDLKLAKGPYECVSSGGHSLMNISITGAGSYSAPEGSGKFHIEPGGKIVFESGPLSQFSSMLLSGHRIGLNTDGGTFYPTACEPH